MKKILSALSQFKKIALPPMPRISQVQTEQVLVLHRAYVKSQADLAETTDRLLAAADDLMECQRRIKVLMAANAELTQSIQTAKNQASKIEWLEARLADREAEIKALAEINVALKRLYRESLQEVPQ